MSDSEEYLHAELSRCNAELHELRAELARTRTKVSIDYEVSAGAADAAQYDLTMRRSVERDIARRIGEELLRRGHIRVVTHYDRRREVYSSEAYCVVYGSRGDQSNLGKG